jgi:hypothetical protein
MFLKRSLFPSDISKRGRGSVPAKLRRSTPVVVALEERALLSAMVSAHGRQPAQVSIAIENRAVHHSLSTSSTHVTFPGGFVNSRPGGTRVTFPGGFVNSRPGGTRVTFPGGFVISNPGSTHVTFPGGFVNSGPGGTSIKFPGGSINIG